MGIDNNDAEFLNQQVNQIKVTQAESKRVLALIAHLRRLFETVLDSTGRGIHPLEMDQADLLLCSASLRTLLFDDSPSPILIDFLNQHKIEVEMETFETDLAMFLLAQVETIKHGHACDLFLQLLFDKEMRDHFEVDKPNQVLLAMDGPNETYSSLRRHPDVWQPNKDEREKLNTYVAYTNLGGPSQVINIIRKCVQIQDWGNVRLGYLKGIPIRRRSIICYVANKLGGIHYDSKRLPANNDDKAEFKILAQAYDWEKQAIMHAGLVAVALASIEIVTHPKIADLLKALVKFEGERRARLMAEKPSK